VSRDPRARALAAALGGVTPADDKEAGDLEATLAFLAQTAHPFDESAQPDHVTASGFVVSALGVVLHRHRLLGIWVQPGGHVDPGESAASAACREVLEETGLVATHLSPPVLVDVDVHPGPRGHRHYDCRWLLTTEGTEFDPGAAESTELGWYLPGDALERCEPGLRSGLAKAFRVARDLGLPGVASWPT